MGKNALSRSHRKQHTKSGKRKKCQTATNGAAARARKSLNGKPRQGATLMRLAMGDHVCNPYIVDLTPHTSFL